MKQKTFLVIILSLLMSCLNIAAQQKLSFSVLEFEQDVFDTSAKSTEHGKKDGNGSWYAIIKVMSNNPDDDITACQFNFGNMASKVEKHDEALWVYVQRNAKKVTISRPGYHTISQYDLQTTIEAGANYKMVLTSDRVQQQVVYDVKMQKVKFMVTPAISGVLIMTTNLSTGKETVIGTTDNNGIVYRVMDSGKYTYRALSSDNLYHPSEGIMTLTSSDDTHEEKILLKPNFADVKFTVDGDAEILINDESRGRGSWDGKLTAGTYVITTRQQNHRDSQQKITVAEGVSQNLVLNSPIPITGTLVVNSTPYEADVMVDGKNRGQSPLIIKDLLIGQHKVLLKKAGYGDYSTEVLVQEQQSVQVDGTLASVVEVKFTCNEPQSTLYVDGKPMGVASGTYKLSFGTHKIEVDVKGYLPYTQNINVSSQNQSHSISLGSISSTDKQKAIKLYDEALELYNKKKFAKAYELYKKSAEMGDEDAQCNLGYMLEMGLGVTKDLTKAVEWYRRSAERGNAYSQCNLANCLYNGNGIERDYSEAAKWYKKAAEQGHAVAQTGLGFCYQFGNGVEKDYSEAMKWWRKSAEQGNAVAQNGLGYCYYNGYGVEKDYSEGVKWWRKSAEQKTPTAYNNLGSAYEIGQGVAKDYNEAMKYYKKAADLGESFAQANIAEMYEYGLGVSKDYSKAFNNYKQSAEKNDRFGQYGVGRCYELGYGVPVDYQEALKWYKLSAEQYDGSFGQYGLGSCYEHGHGVAQNYDEAFKYYKLSANVHNSRGEYGVGRCYEFGYGVGKNLATAIQWYKKAAENGSDDAEEALKRLQIDL